MNRERREELAQHIGCLKAKVKALDTVSAAIIRHLPLGGNARETSDLLAELLEEEDRSSEEIKGLETGGQS